MKQKFGMVLPIVLLTYFLILLDNSIIFTGTVKIANELNLDARSLSWISNAYSLTFGGLLLAMGRAGDLFGRKNIFIVGLFVFALGSLAVGISNSDLTIIIARAFQGVGSSILAPSTLALIMDAYTGKMRTKAIGYYGATAGVGGISGLILGGWIADAFSWRYGFLINVPIAIIVAILSIQYIPKSRVSSGNIDYLGTILSVIGMATLVYSIVGESGNALSLMLSAVAFIILILVERRVEQPLLPLKIFADRERSGAYIARFAFMGAMFSYWFLTPQAMQNNLNFSTLTVGLAFIPMSIPQFISGMKSADLSARFGNTKVLLIGLALSLIGLLIPTFINIHYGYWLVVALPMILLGFGQGLALSPLTVAGVAHTGPDVAGAASGVVNTTHQIGASVGLSLVIAITSGIKSPDILYQHAMFIDSGLVAIALIVVVIIIYPVSRQED
ncbi:MFS transporter [Leuconostoc pseudomesenteroides]|jgi:EmrB/QacA subfamily drug resistance transporter|uniref:MFS transporter n=1 Tax=Leuconostoc falkenbergense TaxID=2766470 RepID=UPI000E091D2D|nr:MFS transporter [Leuconostoc falkenbergense]MCT4410761.1 MFS transporter [Leuconostoc falkenbergense]MDV3544728.1 MFS transporter [Leuconostoc falkenbergense]RDG19124.1 MFS transporter [Leuconostoc pseudomesenteroides]VTU70729.1 MFS transporter [Lactobacillus alimentarius DSM] [Leuconostoc pseudomesenteroides]